MLAHQPVQNGEHRSGLDAQFRCHDRRGALDPGDVGVAFRLGAGEDGLLGPVGVDQLALFALKRQLGALDLDDLMDALGLGQRC